MGGRNRSLAAGLAGLVGVALWSVWMTGAAAAPAPLPRPSLHGTIEGKLQPSSRLTIRLVAGEEGGFQGLHQLQVFLLFHSVILDDLAYEQEAQTISTASSFPIKVGSAQEARGAFFDISGRDVSVSTAGDTMSVTFRPTLVEAVPQGAVFSLGVIDDGNEVRRIVRPVTLPRPNRGFSWGTLAASVLAALLAGGFIGGMFASRRRQAPRVSVYASVQRRLEEDRARP